MDQRRLKEVLHYDEQTGVFTWLKGTNFVPAGSQAGSTRNPDGTGYRIICVDGKTHAAHRLAFLYMTGKFPENVVDHIDGNSGNNAWHNLRDVTSKVNSRNRKRSLAKTATGITGVYVYGDKYKALIGINRKVKHLGVFDTIEEAARVRSEAEKFYGFTDRHGGSE